MPIKTILRDSGDNVIISDHPEKLFALIGIKSHLIIDIGDNLIIIPKEMIHQLGTIDLTKLREESKK